MKTVALNSDFQKDYRFIDARNFFWNCVQKVELPLWKEGASFENMNKGVFYLDPEDPLRYTQITTRHVVIKAPAIPDRTHSAVSITGKTAKSQGHTVW